MRHTTELLLKGLIIKEKIKITNKLDISKITIQENAICKNINAVHSLFYLWENYKLLNKNNRLIPCFSIKQELSIDKVIKFFNDKDFNSTTFRYPYSKQGKPIVIEPLDFNNSGKAPELGTKPPMLIQCGDTVCIIKKVYVISHKHKNCLKLQIYYFSFINKVEANLQGLPFLLQKSNLTRQYSN